jgi:probable F420-dependent oxidoreductase
LATLDLFSGGRIEVGLGAGWIEAEYDAMGVPYDRPGIRIERLGEVIDVLRSSFVPGLLDVEGAHNVRAVGFEGTPKTLQQPAPPIAVGGAGRRVLELAARKADIVCINRDNRAGRVVPEGNRSSRPSDTLERIGWVRDAARDRFEDIVFEVGAYYISLTDDTQGAAELWGRRLGIPTEDALSNPHVLIGTVDSICDQLEERRERFRISYLTVRDAKIEAFAPVVARLSGT